MRLGHCLLATSLLAGSATSVAAQNPDPEPRPERRWIRIEPGSRRPFSDFYRYRMAPDRMRIVERALERSARARSSALDQARSRVELAERMRARASDRSLDQLDRMRDREFAMRDGQSERLRINLRRNQEIRERSMERVRERMDRLRDEHRVMIRRRSRTI